MAIVAEKPPIVDPPATPGKESEPCLDIATRTFRRYLEAFFNWLGLLVGRHPKRTIFLSLVVVAGLGAGLACWKEEEDVILLWTGSGTQLRRDAFWVKKYFPDTARFQHVIVEADNVLDPKVIRFLSRLDEAVKGIKVDGHGWSDVCAGYHELFGDDSNGSRRRKRTADNSTDEEKSHCLTRHLLRLWDTNRNVIYDLNEAEIRNKLTSILVFGATSDPPDLSDLLSGVSYDAKGQVVGAKATWMTWMLKKDEEATATWEREFVPTALAAAASSFAPAGVRVWALAARSYEDSVGQVVKGDVPALIGGVALMLVFAAMALGRCGLARPRAALAVLGVVVAPMALLAAYGGGAALGVPAGPIHCILPFLLLGVGVDDMFVLLQALASVPKGLSVPARLAETLRQAGVAVTVTSFSNVAAFAAGAVTTVPALRWFCLHAAGGILALLALHVTFFAACVALDEARRDRLEESKLEKSKTVLISKVGDPGPSSSSCCLPIRIFSSACSGTAGRDFLQEFFSNWMAPWLLCPGGKVATVAVAVSLGAASCYGVMHLQNNFDRLLYLQPESDPARFLHAVRRLFPAEGERAAVYLPPIDFLQERQRLISLQQLLQDCPYVRPGSVKFWMTGLQEWLNSKNETFPTSRDDFMSQSSDFLIFSPEGHKFIQDVRFTGFPFGDFNITASRMRFAHLPLANTTQQREAMAWLRSLASHVTLPSSLDPSGSAFAYADAYVTWEANQAISRELGRNLGLTLAAVAAVTLILLPNVRACFWVLACVALTLLEVGGAIYFWGLALELVTSLVVILAAGLAVDYAAHVAHVFVHTGGTRNDRGRETLARIGPAVLNGGLSTFLAFALLADSKSYVFLTFFKLILAVVTFGLFQGLFLLPVVLSWCGPDSSESPSTSAHSSPPEEPKTPIITISLGVDNHGYNPPTPPIPHPQPTSPLPPRPVTPHPDYTPEPSPKKPRRPTPPPNLPLQIPKVKPLGEIEEEAPYSSDESFASRKFHKKRRPGRHLSAPDIYEGKVAPPSYDSAIRLSSDDSDDASSTPSTFTKAPSGESGYATPEPVFSGCADKKQWQ